MPAFLLFCHEICVAYFRQRHQEYPVIPPVPPYEGLHPIVVHFPIALLAIVPLFIISAAVWRTHSRILLVTGLTICALGTAFAFLATSTGEAAEKMAQTVSGAGETLREHEQAAKLGLKLFVGYTIVLGGATVTYISLFARVRTGWRIAAAFVLLFIYVFPALVLMKAGHLGGRLVHVHGVRAPMGVNSN